MMLNTDCSLAQDPFGEERIAMAARDRFSIAADASHLECVFPDLR